MPWLADIVRHRDLVPAGLLRPFEEQCCEVWSELEECRQLVWLHGWRRPSGYPPEGETSTDRLYPYGYPASRLRRPTELAARYDAGGIY